MCSCALCPRGAPARLCAARSLALRAQCGVAVPRALTDSPRPAGARKERGWSLDVWPAQDLTGAAKELLERGDSGVPVFRVKAWHVAARRREHAPGDADSEPAESWYRWHVVILTHSKDSMWGGIKSYGGFIAVRLTRGYSSCGAWYG